MKDSLNALLEFLQIQRQTAFSFGKLSGWLVLLLIRLPAEGAFPRKAEFICWRRQVFLSIEHT